ncbi:tripartite tricarboxylate transporter substrate binding protein [Oceanidesulfovibrio indonesiensis]|uniref:Tripartite tricarboxylate transporter substrate binding protein n=1 Tax=Oceanidesulfovibrio indonesiensis TaxID=54767 RepID=A0A7M3MJ10_9BACT|nr:tripartite tricarboxylate transporter substrate binding protein [Oceanidesulfovibrio indonesiensis]TVM19301.1 tripartite tricarboxylate transporter substrate binding protein [Oceanidesulfovibrio indonesiensis]
MKKLITMALAFSLVLGLGLVAQAEDYPSEPITYSIPFNPGGQSDLEARRQQPMLEDILGVSVIIQYKPGGGGSVGWAELVRAKPNGYFITGINVPHIVLQPLARGNAGFETEQIKPIAFFQATPIGLAVLKDSQFQTLEDLVEFAKANPGAITAGGSGTWSGHHIANLQLQEKAGIELTYVPHKGAAPSVAAFLGGHVQALWANSNDLYQHRDKIRVLGFGTKEPFEPMPEVPTFEAQGYDLYASIDRGAGAPPGTPDEKIKVLEDAFLKIANDPKIKEQMLNDGFVPLSMGAEESAKYIQEKIEDWKPVVEKFQQ